MAQQSKKQDEKEKNKKKGFWWFFQQKKNLPLILSLLGGGATVITGTLLLSSPASSSQGSNSTIISSSASTSLGGSQPFSGNQVPDWDLSNPTISSGASGFGIGYDVLWFNRYQEQYLYQSGINYAENETPSDVQIPEAAFSIFNVRTSSLVFFYQFDSGSTFKGFLEDNPEYSNQYNSDIRIAYDQDSTVYAFINVNLQLSSNDIASRRGGDYQPMVDYILDNNFTITNNQFAFMISFDLESPSDYQILGATSNYAGYVYPNDILFVDHSFYLSMTFSKQVYVNPLVLNGIPTFSFAPLPEVETLPVFTNSTNLTSYAFIYSYDYTTNNELVLRSTDSISTNLYSWIWFEGYRVGFDTKYITDDGSLRIGLNFGYYVDSSEQFDTKLNALEDNFVAENEKADVYNRLLTNLTTSVSEIDDYNQSVLAKNLNFSIRGSLNLDTSEMSEISVATNVWQSQTVNGEQINLSSYYYESLIITESGDKFEIQQYIFTIWTPTNRNNSNYNPDNLQHSISVVNRIQSNGSSTEIYSHDGDGVIISGIYEREGGYYIIGNYYENESKPNVQNVDAFLQKVDTNFDVLEEVVFAGSGDDLANIITLGNNGQPIFVVYSNSIDGSFEDFATDNPDRTMVTYVISF